MKYLGAELGGDLVQPAREQGLHDGLHALHCWLWGVCERMLRATN